MTEARTAFPMSILFILPIVVLLQLATFAQSNPQGLTLRLSPQDGDATDVRRARTVSLYVRQGESVSPFLPDGPFTATWEGALTFDDFGKDITISARGRGTLNVSVNGENVFDGDLKGGTRVEGGTVGIQNGKNPLNITYESPDDGDAWLRLYWSADDFYPEPLPVDQLVHERTDRLKRQTKRRKGRSLFLNHRCVRCHQDERDRLDQGAFELNMDAPDLSAAGTKFRTDWMAKWIADPARYRDDASMPAVLHGRKKRVQRKAKKIAAYLSSRTDASVSGPDVSGSDEQVNEGSRHFRRFGCVACHTLSDQPDQEQSDTPGDRMSLAYVAKKWKPGPLAGYLMNPRTHYSWNPMPDFRLSEEQASALAAFLMEKTGGNKQEDSGDVSGKKWKKKRGKKLMRKRGCNQCHAGDSGNNRKRYRAPSLRDVFSTVNGNGLHGCIAESGNRKGKAPDFEFNTAEREALKVFLAEASPGSLSRSVPAEFASRQVERLRCVSCHRRDGQASVWSRLPDEQTEVKLDHDRTEGVKQLRPPLTWVGDMLQYDWMKRTITGTLEEKTRPKLVARMPGFGPYGEGLAKGLAAQHGFPPERVSFPSSSLKRGRKGKKIVEKLNCYSCHSAGDRESNTFEVAGINFVKSGKRLHRNFAIRWTLAPGRVRNDTGMPAFFQWGEPSPLSNILDGDLRKQMDALWQYLRHVEKLESN